MIQKCFLRISADHYRQLHSHLFPGDGDEHGAVLLAGMSIVDGRITLLVREVHLAREGVDYVAGSVGYRALTPKFIHRMITRARDERLVYLAVHNHASDEHVDFSRIDLASHARGYPALLQIARGMPVGALVLGKNSIEADLWLPDSVRLRLDHAVVVGNTIRKLRPAPLERSLTHQEVYDRQTRWFGKAGQAELAQTRVGIIGLGGIGSLIAELLARLGVGGFHLIDGDQVEDSNLSRIVGATAEDAKKKRLKVDVAERVIRTANPHAHVKKFADDVVKAPIAAALAECDYLFLAADSMRARLICNAMVHQHLIPAVQVGAKVRADEAGTLLEVMSANRPIRPGRGCLWCNQLIDPTQLAQEAKSDQERKNQAYGTQEPNPSVITLNAVAASHAVNDFLLHYLCLIPDTPALHYEHFHHLSNVRKLVQPRLDPNCSECACHGMRYAQGSHVELPCADTEK
ncbi:MAG TPA: ThiF family adenylyltransferase [Noviherbaspirillum sp.]|nr:ThiF family adenylyltransferase [Noviherbaspirillum sp.]